MGIKEVSKDELVTDDAKEEWKRFMQFNKTVDVLFRDRYFIMSLYRTVRIKKAEQNKIQAKLQFSGKQLQKVMILLEQ